MEYTGASVIADILKLYKTKMVFGYPGAANAPMYEAMAEAGIVHILPRGEQAAVHAASGYARASGKVGVCMATSGPGATNLITGIANAYMDSTPIVAITGQVETDKIGQDVFQEVDITGATAPFCKHNYLVKDANELEEVLKNAFYIASTGRKGPVLVDVPMDVQLQSAPKITTSTDVNIKGYKPSQKANGMQVKRVIKALAKAKRPIILAGGGVISSGAQKQLLQFAETADIPIVCTMMGLGAVETTHPLYVGMVGSHGFSHASWALNHADLVIVAGARMADRAIDAVMHFQDCTVVHIDVDPAEIGKVISVDIPVVGDVRNVLADLNEKVKGDFDHNEWYGQIMDNREHREIQEKEGVVNPRLVMEILSDVMPKNAIITTEVGQNQLWAARGIRFSPGDQFISSGGLGTMGYGLPAAVGAQFADKGRTVIAIEGDGSLQMSMPELATIAGNNLNIKIILLKNKRLGMVNELQKNKKYRQYAVFLDGSPDFCKLADAYGIANERVNQNGQVKQAIETMLAHPGVYLLEMAVDPEEKTLL